MKKWDWTGKRKIMVLSVLVCMAAGMVLSACSNQEKKQVLAEKTQENPETGDSSEEPLGADPQTGDSGTGNPALENPAGETAQNGEAGNVSGGDSQSGQPLSEVVEAPKQYEAQVEGKQVQLTADADVVVPSVDAIPVLPVKKVPWSQDDFAAFKHLTADIAGIQWAEDQPMDDGVIDVLSQDGKYQLSFVDGEQENSTPILWMKHLYLFGGEDSHYDSGNSSDWVLSGEEKKKVEVQITAEAEQFLKSLGQGDFIQKNCRWKEVLERAGESDASKPSSHYGLKLKYARTYRGVPAAGNVQTLMGKSAPSGQYVEFFYTSDGMLLEVKVIGREVEEDVGEEDRFLLPFAAVTQIFEQYCKTYSTGDISTGVGGDFASDGGTPVLIPIENAEDMKIQVSKTQIYVDNVMLEYRYEQDGKQQSAGGHLVPVWNFYGRQGEDAAKDSTLITSDSTVQIEKEGLLVSIHAEDGTIYGK